MRGSDIGDMLKLRAQATFVVNFCRPRNDHRIGGAAEVRRIHLCSLEWSAESPGPGRSKMIHVQLAALRITQRQSLLDGEGFPLIVLGIISIRAAFGAGAVVSEDFDDERVVTLSGIMDFLEKPANFVVRLLGESRIYLGLVCQQLLFICRKRLPRRQACRARRQLRICRNHAELLLALKCLFPNLVPSRIELSFVLRDP